MSRAIELSKNIHNRDIAVSNWLEMILVMHSEMDPKVVEILPEIPPKAVFLFSARCIAFNDAS